MVNNDFLRASAVARSYDEKLYDVIKNLINPYASIELYHDKKGLEKIRYTLGTVLGINKKNEFNLFYRYQDYSDDDGGAHVLGLGYKYKF